MSKKSWPILYNKLLYKNESGVLGHTVMYMMLQKKTVEINVYMN